MDEEQDIYGESIFEGAAGYSGVEGFGEDTSPVPPPEPPPMPPPAPPVQPPLGPPPGTVTPAQPPPAMPWSVDQATSPLVDIMSTLGRVAGGAAIGYYGSDTEEDRMKNAAIGAAASYAGIIPLLGFCYYMAKKKGR